MESMLDSKLEPIISHGDGEVKSTYPYFEITWQTEYMNVSEPGIGEAE